MLLTLQNLQAHYGKSHVLRGVSFGVDAGEVVSLVGRNGSGRSTTLKTILGMVPPTGGSIRLDGAEQAGRPTRRIVRDGIAYVPEERLVFADLTVEENLRLGQLPAQPGRATWDIAGMYDYFPRLKERRHTRAGKLSGGEQQMLTICRSLLGNPRVILIDEPTEGLAPRIVDRVVDVILDISRHGVAVLLIEQRLTIALEISHRVLVMGHGRIVHEGLPEELRENGEVHRRWLAVSAG